MSKTVWISTAARTGSMWVFNVTRQLVREAGFELKPKNVPLDDKETLQIFSDSAKSPKDTEYLVLKVHAALNPGLANSKIISTHRDPRDSIVSYMGFMKMEFEQAFTATKIMSVLTEKYKSWDENSMKLIAFHDIENEPDNVVGIIANFLDIEVNKETISSIVEQFSKKNVQKLIADTDRKLIDKISNKQALEKGDVVFLSNTNYRSFDQETGFQSRHVSSRKTGDWAKILTKGQIDEVNEHFSDWMDEFGYEH